MTEEERYIYQYRQVIRVATRDIYQGDLPIHLRYLTVDADLIGAIILDELERRDVWDTVQETGARFFDLCEGSLERVGHWLLHKTFKPLTIISLGPAQMKPFVVEELVAEGLIAKPPSWEEDKTDIIVQWLLNPQKVPELVGARLEQIVRHWAKGNIDISDRPEILATLYSIGLTGKAGIHANPQANTRGRRIAQTLRQQVRTMIT